MREEAEKERQRLAAESEARRRATEEAERRGAPTHSHSASHTLLRQSTPQLQTNSPSFILRNHSNSYSSTLTLTLTLVLTLTRTLTLVQIEDEHISTSSKTTGLTLLTQLELTYFRHLRTLDSSKRG